MIRMKVSTDNPLLKELEYRLAKMGTQAGAMKSTAKVMEAGARLIQMRWIDFAGGGALKGVERLKSPSGGYARSIRTKQIGPFEHEIYSDSKVARWIEYGTDAYDMTTKHPRGPRSRISKDGVPYLIVPFQWGTKEGTVRSPRNTIPNSLLSLMQSRKFKKSSVGKETYRTTNAQGGMADRATYSWGSRVKGSDFAGTVLEKLRASGMVRFEQGTSRKRYGAYFTFRVITPHSRGWIRPARPARHVTKAVAAETRETINAMVDTAIMEDLGL